MAVLAIGLSGPQAAASAQWLVSRLEMVRLNTAYVVASGIVMLLLGQIAVFWPALRASRLPPALAVRGA